MFQLPVKTMDIILSLITKPLDRLKLQIKKDGNNEKTTFFYQFFNVLFFNIFL